MLNTHELNVFIEAAQVENFSVAASRLDLSQPAVSLQIRSLERQLGIELFRRNGRNVTLSDAGRILLPLAQELLHQAKHVEEVMWGLQGVAVGELSVVCSTTVGKYVLPRLIAAFRRRYPDVQVAVKVLGRQPAAEWLLEGRAEIGLVSCDCTYRDLESRPFLQDQVILIVPAGHPWADGREITPADLPSLPLIIDESTSGVYEVLVEGLRQQGMNVADLGVAMTLDSAEAIEMAVEAGLGAAFVSRPVAARGLALGCIKEVPIRGMSLTRSICMVRHQRRTATPPQEAFWNFAFDSANAAIRQWLQ